MTTAPTPDPLTALAAELGRIGQRLAGMGVELMTLRHGMGAAGAASPPEGRTVALGGEGGATSGHGGPAASPWGGPPVGGGGVAATGEPWPGEPASSAGSAGLVAGVACRGRLVGWVRGIACRGRLVAWVRGPVPCVACWGRSPAVATCRFARIVDYADDWSIRPIVLAAG